MPEESSDRSVDKFNPELAFVGGVEESSARSETTGGRSEDLNTKAREGGEGEGKAFVLSPVQDELVSRGTHAILHMISGEGGAEPLPHSISWPGDGPCPRAQHY